MRTTFSFLLFLLLTAVSSQEDFLAKQYFNDGAFEKAVVFYEKLVLKNPRRTDYGEGLIACYQQLERYGDAEKYLLKQLENPRAYPTFYVELGYNHTLQNEDDKAREYYEKALARIEENPNYGYGIGFRFQKYALLDWALSAYSKAMELNPELDYNYQMAKIYGEQGDVEKMYRSYLTLISEGKTSKSNVLRSIDDFISSDPENGNNLTLKKVLLENAQRNPDILWNELLSWLFVQQKQFRSAFRQEKAIYKRMDGSSMQRLEGLGELTLEENDYEIAQEIFEYIVENTADKNTRLNAQLNLIDLQLLDANAKTINAVQQQYEELMEIYGYDSQTLQLQVAFANFLTFKKDTPAEAIDILKKSLELPLNQRGKAFIKLALGDILVYDQKFNEALIYFSQIQKGLKNDVLGQDARFKVAQTSFYKGDFDWALTQLKVLRGSTSQLIANDAMQLSLLISDNSLEDSTQTALKKYARADLLGYQNKTREAIDTLDDILQNHKGEKIEDDALLKQGELLENLKEYEAAEFNYLKITEFYADGILADDAHFALGELYRKILKQPEKAKSQYEKIIYNHQDSYYFPQARKNFRMLRGDSIN
ncbi:tetratricopeptide repeat protein [Flavobacteriaceae bacterium TP-CH-4]|uniref:Tetratricopeptide repeat protein n=1 Tax=Pelagihabitans pacificus TaxID=2696054 RepID=A0A967EER2_9FLAO|nr:tetratricopeptide repeat protein [Pelagihabitans pacificus]NHF60633.1 tetratricopeptide repeat protein [Pelagihabitans pacificus]